MAKKRFEKRIIGISSVNVDNKIGSIFTSLVVISPDFQRKYPKVDPKFIDAQFITRAKKEILQYEVGRITPNHLAIAELSTLLNEQYGHIVNLVRNFWENTEIYHDIKDLDPKLNVGVKKEHKLDSSLLKYNPNAYAVKVARQFAQTHLFQECVEIKKTYGDYGEGTDLKTEQFIKENPSCVWIRK